MKLKQHGRAELLEVSKLDEACSIIAARQLLMTHRMKRILRLTGDSKNTIPCHLYLFVQHKFVDLKILSWFIQNHFANYYIVFRNCQ